MTLIGTNFSCSNFLEQPKRELKRKGGAITSTDVICQSHCESVRLNIGEHDIYNVNV